MGVVIGNSGGQKRRKRSYMIRISQLKLSVNHSEEDLKKKAAKMLKLQPGHSPCNGCEAVCGCEKKEQ